MWPCMIHLQYICYQSKYKILIWNRKYEQLRTFFIYLFVTLSLCSPFLFLSFYLSTHYS